MQSPENTSLDEATSVSPVGLVRAAQTTTSWLIPQHESKEQDGGLEEIAVIPDQRTPEA